MRAFVYYSLHPHCLSVRATQGPARGRVVLHARAVELENATFRVSAVGRARVLRDKVKNVHAGIVGELKGHLALEAASEYEERAWLRRLDDLPGAAIAYSPYRWASFVQLPTQVPAEEAERVVVVDKRIRASGLERMCS